MNAYHFRSTYPPLNRFVFVVVDNSVEAAIGRLIADDKVWSANSLCHYPSLTYNADTIHEKWGFKTHQVKKWHDDTLDCVWLTPTP